MFFICLALFYGEKNYWDIIVKIYFDNCSIDTLFETIMETKIQLSFSYFSQFKVTNIALSYSNEIFEMKHFFFKDLAIEKKFFDISETNFSFSKSYLHSIISFKNLNNLFGCLYCNITLKNIIYQNSSLVLIDLENTPFLLVQECNFKGLLIVKPLISYENLAKNEIIINKSFFMNIVQVASNGSVYFSIKYSFFYLFFLRLLV